MLLFRNKEAEEKLIESDSGRPRALGLRLFFYRAWKLLNVHRSQLSAGVSTEESYGSVMTCLGSAEKLL